MKKPLIIGLICLVASAALLIWGFQSPASPSSAPQRQVVLLIENDTGSFLMQLRKGMQEAASALDVRITVEKALPDPLAQVRALAEEGADAALLLLADPKPLLSALEEAKFPVVLIGQTVRGQVCVTGDDRACGEALVSRALALAEPSRVLWLTQDTDPRGLERTDGAMAQLKQKGIAILPWPQSPQTLASYGAVAASTQAITQELANLKSTGSLGPGVSVLGMDTGDSRVADLEDGHVQVMAMDSPYAMGYTAIGLIPSLVAQKLAPSLHLCRITLVDPSTMYLAENVKLVFPLLQ